MSSFYSENELRALGLQRIGDNVLISRNASIYGASSISIGNSVRIDDFCILSGKIVLGSNIHIAAGVYCFGGHTGIYMDDYVGVSSRTVIYAESDDYSGEYLTNPTIPDNYRKVLCGKIHLNKHSIIGTGCTILPGVTVGEGTSVGGMSLVNKSLDEWGIYAGVPCRRLKDRSKNMLDFEKQLLNNTVRYQK